MPRTKAQDDYDKKNGLKTCGYKIKMELAESFKSECQKRGTSQAKEIQNFMKEFIKNAWQIR